MAKSAVNHAIKHKVRLGRWGNGHGAKTGHYYILDGNSVVAVSNGTSATDAIAMMKRKGFR